MLRNEEQREALTKIIQVVHAKGGFWFQQLFHVGRSTSPALVKRARQRAGLPDPPPYGYLPVSASAVAESGINTHSGEPFGVPHALTVDELRALRDDYKRTAQIAFEAGADGIEVSLLLLAKGGEMVESNLSLVVAHLDSFRKWLPTRSIPA